MKIQRIASLWSLLPLAAGCLLAQTNGSPCTVKDFRGVYAFRAVGTIVTNNLPIMFAGSLTADGNGNIIAWKDWVSLAADPPMPPNFKIVPPVRDIHALARSIGNDITYAVEPDCRITITTAVPGPIGVVPIFNVGALASAGEQALLINGAPGSPYLTEVLMKRAKKLTGDEAGN